mgnify:CR=1 FL=1
MLSRPTRYYMDADKPTDMTIGRGLLTEGERKYLRGESSDQRMYEARSRFRTRVKESVTEDIELLEQHQPELLDELRDVVCEND